MKRKVYMKFTKQYFAACSLLLALMMSGCENKEDAAKQNEANPVASATEKKETKEKQAVSDQQKEQIQTTMGTEDGKEEGQEKEFVFAHPDKDVPSGILSEEEATKESGMTLETKKQSKEQITRKGGIGDPVEIFDKEHRNEDWFVKGPSHDNAYINYLSIRFNESNAKKPLYNEKETLKMLEAYLPTDATFEKIIEIANYTDVLSSYTLMTKNYTAFYNSKRLAQRSPNKDGSITLEIHTENVYTDSKTKELIQSNDFFVSEAIIKSGELHKK